MSIATTPGQDASRSQGYPPAVCCRYPFIHLGEEKESRLKSLVKETTRRARCEPRTFRSGVQGVNHSATHASQNHPMGSLVIFFFQHFFPGLKFGKIGGPGKIYPGPGWAQEKCCKHCCCCRMQTLQSYLGYQRFFSRAAGIFIVGRRPFFLAWGGNFRRWLKADTSSTVGRIHAGHAGNSARKVSGTEGTSKIEAS